MAENLAYLPEVNSDSATSSVDKRYYVYGYEGSDVIAAKNTEIYKKFGVLYNWPAAMNGASGINSASSSVQGSCPSGWHVPSDAEWMVLEKTLGMSEADLIMETPTSFRSSGSVNMRLKSPFGWEDDDIFVGQS
ncbi:MAG: FISUMP domain-containing protein, partial [Deltaproteobacteria bacterium]|nr:FISUMP domain-containing protein [Deltaproteobacteria bacterium]